MKFETQSLDFLKKTLAITNNFIIWSFYLFNVPIVVRKILKNSCLCEVCVSFSFWGHSEYFQEIDVLWNVFAYFKSALIVSFVTHEIFSNLSGSRSTAMASFNLFSCRSYSLSLSAFFPFSYSWVITGSNPSSFLESFFNLPVRYL